MDDRLYRSRTDRVISGVAGGMAEHWRLDPSLVRVGWVLLAVFSGGIFVLVYIVMMIVVPESPYDWTRAPGTPGAGTWGGTEPGTWGVAGTGGTPGPDAGAPGQGWAPGATGSAVPPQWGTDWRPPEIRPTTGPGTPGIVIGIALIVLGLVFLLDRFVDVDFAYVWPLLIVGLGVLLIAGAIRRGAR